MQDPTTTLQRAQLIGAEPQLFVTDMAASIEHYRKLGFEVVFTYGDPAFYGQVARDGVPLNLRLTHTLPFDPAVMRDDSLLAVTLLTNDVEQLYRECAAAVEIHQPLRQEPWGARTFIIADPDGNLLLFAGPA